MVAKTTSSLVWLAALSGLVLLLSGPTVGARAATSPRELEKALLEQVAPAVLHYVDENGYMNVGVLKGRVKKGDGDWTDNAGTFNTNLANRLELALIDKDNIKDPVVILHQSSQTAARIQGANHLTEDGRKLLFRWGNYPPAWGKDTRKAHTFVVADAEFSPDRRRVTLYTTIYGKHGEVKKLDPIQVRSTVGMLAEIGERFSLRGAFDETDSEKVETVAFTTVNDVKAPAELLQDSPVELKIYYHRGEHYDPATDEIHYKLENGQATIPDPEKGQYCTFVLKRTEVTHNYGVLLMVNGESTIYHQQGDPAKLTKWILRSDAPVEIRGYQKKKGGAERFVGLAREESGRDRFNYTPHTGTIQMTVFREAIPTDLPPGEVPPELASVSEAKVLSPKGSLAAAKFAINTGDPGPPRGIIVGTEVVDSDVEPIDFKISPVPVFSATITYFKP